MFESKNRTLALNKHLCLRGICKLAIYIKFNFEAAEPAMDLNWGKNQIQDSPTVNDAR